MHDSELAAFGRVYDKLHLLYERNGGKCVMDSAFCARGNDFVIKSIQNYHSAKNADEFMMLTEATSMRQAAEWGMRALQGSFPRLKCRIVYEEKGERQLIIESIVLLYNWRANTVGINQIRTTFMPYLDKYCDRMVNDLL